MSVLRIHLKSAELVEGGITKAINTYEGGSLQSNKSLGDQLKSVPVDLKQNPATPPPPPLSGDK